MSKKVHTEEFKQSAVEMIVGQNNTVRSVSNRLGINYHTVREWVRSAKSRSPTSLISKDLPIEQRCRELETENTRLRMEREILKKAAAFFAKECP